MANFKNGLTEQNSLNEDFDLNEFDDELNDETFGAPVQDDWEAIHEEYAILEKKASINNLGNKKKNNNESINTPNHSRKIDIENENDDVLINNTLNRVAHHHLIQQIQFNSQQNYLNSLHQKQSQIQFNSNNNLNVKPYFVYPIQQFITSQTPNNVNNDNINFINNNFADININSKKPCDLNFINNKNINNKNPIKALTLEELEKTLIHEENENNILDNLQDKNQIPLKHKDIQNVKENDKSFLCQIPNDFSKKVNIFENKSLLNKFPEINFQKFNVNNNLQLKNHNQQLYYYYNNYYLQLYNQNQILQHNNLNFLRINNQPLLMPNPLNPKEMIKMSGNYKNQNPKNCYSNKQHYHSKKFNNDYCNDIEKNENLDEYAGLMTQKDINWIKKIQNLQLEFEDSYVEDYYFVNYQTKKIASELKKRDKLNGQNHSVPVLVIPERGCKMQKNITDLNSTDLTKYVLPTFSGSLGKIQISNVNCPRKMIDFNNKLEKLNKKKLELNVEPQGRIELNKFRKLLLDIEKNLTLVLKIDHEDKKIAALPMTAQIRHIEERKRLCDELFSGILTTEDNKNINFKIANVRKGCMLIFKALQVLHDPFMKTIIIADLLKVDNFHYVVMQKDKTLYCLDYGQVLSDAIKTIKDCNFNYLLKIAEGLDDPSFVAKFQCGQEIIEVLLEQCKYFKITENDQKLQWLSFLERVLEDVDDIPHLRKICNDHIYFITNKK